MVIEINKEIEEKFSKSQMVGSLEQNLAFVIILFGPENFHNTKFETV